MASGFSAAVAALAESIPVYRDSSKDTAARVEDLLNRLTLDEKIALVHANTKFATPGIPRLGIPQFWLSDGPNGVREEVKPDAWEAAGHTDDFATAMPTLIGLAATWNPHLARDFGEVLGSEARARGKQVLLGPGVNIQRTPLGGRNFEFLSEDPWLTSRLAVADIEGIQSQGVAACVKHFAANNQEYERMTIDVEVDERTLREIYLPAFQAAVQEAGVLTVMGAYNELRGQHCCENDYLLNQVLKTEWGFKGMVVSDWDGAHNTDEAVRNGLDLEMGTKKPYDEYYLARPFAEGVRQGIYPMALLDDKVRRGLRVMFLLGTFDHTGGPGAFNTPAHQAAALRVAEESLVLLKNRDAVLPLDLKAIRSVAVIGENAIRLQCHDGGSSKIKALYEVTPLAGIIQRFGTKANVTFSRGYSSEKGAAAEDLMAQAVAAAKAADVAIVVGGLNHAKSFDAEEADRKDLALPFGQNELIRRVVAANPRTVVVLISGGAVDMTSWVDQVPALVEAWYPGMEGGNAIAAVLSGDVNPSGKLPCTFPRRLEDSPAHALGAYPGTNGTEVYKEGLLVGYRWFDTKKVEPLFPFGYGLSYTQFTYGKLQVSTEGESKGGWKAELELTNSGTSAGAETVELYVHPEAPSVERPDQELKGFSKVFLRPGERQTVTIPLSAAAFAYFDPKGKHWVAQRGAYELRAGSSSRDIRAKAELTLDRTRYLP